MVLVESDFGKNRNDITVHIVAHDLSNNHTQGGVVENARKIY